MKKIFLIVALISFGVTQGQDRIFNYTYQSTVLGKGQKELEVWNTLRVGRDKYYARLDNRTEFEIGLGGNLQTAFYLNLTSKSSTNALDQIKTENEISFSNEWKLKLLDPVANPIGLALYAEYGIGSNEYELEGKLILDKKINNFTVATNLVYELELAPEVINGETEWEKEKKIDVDLALAYSFNPNFAITMENVYKNVIENGEVEHSALYSGVGFSYVLDKFWANFTVLPQVKSFKGHSAGETTNLNEFEKVQFRLLFSYVF